MKKNGYVDLFEEIFSAPFSKSMKEEAIKPLGAGNSAGIKLVLDAHTLTNKVANYKKGYIIFEYFASCFLFLERESE